MVVNRVRSGRFNCRGGAVVYENASGGAPKVNKGISTCAPSPDLSSNQCNFLSNLVSYATTFPVLDQNIGTRKPARVTDTMAKKFNYKSNTAGRSKKNLRKEGDGGPGFLHLQLHGVAQHFRSSCTPTPRRYNARNISRIIVTNSSEWPRR
jgi:hypothetical protein